MAGKGQVVRFKEGKMVFEILTKTDAVLAFQDGRLGWNDVLITDAIFTNSSKGDLAKDADLQAVFGTDDPVAVAKIIVEKGKLQLTSAQRKKFVDDKRQEIIGYLH